MLIGKLVSLLYQVAASLVSLLYHKPFYKTFKILPITLALCLMLLETYYAQNYAGILGLGLHNTLHQPLNIDIVIP